MATDYPGGLDVFTALLSGNQSAPTAEGRRHRARHNDVEDAVEAIEAELGTDPSGAADTVAARLTALDVTVAGKEADGAAAAAVAAHAADGDPHSQYATDSDLAAHVASATAHIPAGAVALGQVGAVRWDETVGRRAFMWDTVNSRWQMIYGDTGWRDISSLSALPGDTTLNALTIRRFGDTVHLYGFIVPGATMTAAARWLGVSLLSPIPAGFQPGTPGTAYSIYHGGFFSSGLQARHFALSNASTSTLLTLALNGDTVTTNWTAQNHIFYTQWPVYEAWPTSLPGTASGSIPVV